MNFNLTQEHELIKKNAKEFADKELLPGVLERDEVKEFLCLILSKHEKNGFLYFSKTFLFQRT